MCRNDKGELHFEVAAGYILGGSFKNIIVPLHRDKMGEKKKSSFIYPNRLKFWELMDRQDSYYKNKVLSPENWWLLYLFLISSPFCMPKKQHKYVTLCCLLCVDVYIVKHQPISLSITTQTLSCTWLHK